MVQPRTPKKARGSSDCPASFPRRSTEARICELRREHPRVGTRHLLPLRSVACGTRLSLLDWKRETSVDDDRLADDHLGLGSAQEADDGRDVLGRDHAARRCSFDRRRNHLLSVWEMVERFRPDGAGRDAVHHDVLGRQLDVMGRAADGRVWLAGRSTCV